jgi:hypothetical protein
LTASFIISDEDLTSDVDLVALEEEINTEKINNFGRELDEIKYLKVNT